MISLEETMLLKGEIINKWRIEFSIFFEYRI